MLHETGGEWYGHNARLVVERAREVFAEDDVRLAWTLIGHGQALERQGRYDDALQPPQQAVVLRRAKLGDEHPLVSQVLVEVGQTLRWAGRFDESEQLLRAALALREATLGNDHPATGVTLDALSMVLQNPGQGAGRPRSRNARDGCPG